VDTYSAQVHVADHSHDGRYLCCCCHASNLALVADISWQPVLVGLEDGCLVQANGRCVYAHVCEDHIRVTNTSRQAKMIGKAQCGLEENLLNAPMTRPESAVDIIVTIVKARSMQMQQIPSKHCCCQHDATQWLQACSTVWTENLIQ
jgi:hypothetical protein